MQVTYERVAELLAQFTERDEVHLTIDTTQDDGALLFDFPVSEFISQLTGVAMNAEFIQQLQDIASMKLEGDEIPGVINFKTATRAEVIDFLLSSERMKKTLKGITEIVESNNNAARGRLGKDMSANNESKLEISDEHGNKLANIKLEVKQRPTWEDKEYQFYFMETIGQGGVIQPSIPWQTVEKIMSDMIDELPQVPYDEDRGFDFTDLFDPASVSKRALNKAFDSQEEQGYFDIALQPNWMKPGVYVDEEKRKLHTFFTYHDGTYAWVMERVGGENTRRIGKLFATTNAKVTKVYDVE